MKFLKEELVREFTFKASRSGGSGGQHVNKVSTKVELNWLPEHSSLLSAEEKELVVEKLSKRISKEGVLQVISEEERSQILNKQKAIQKAFQLIHESLLVPKKRKATKPSKSSIEKRLETKRKQSLRKINRNFRPD